MVKGLLIWLCLLPCLALGATNTNMPLLKAPINLKDKASLQRGAKYYMNYCAGCHSLKYMRYKSMAKDIGILDDYGDVAKKLVDNNLIFTGAKFGDLINIAMSMPDAREWFGVEPPDLTLETRVRGSDWVYTYLMSFYQDPKRPLGANNRLFPDVAMPNVLAPLQGEQIAIWGEKTIPYNGGTKQIPFIKHLQLLRDGQMSEHQFNAMVTDIVNFLTYTAEPMKLKRQVIGVWTMIFLLIFLVLAYLLKKEYWKDVH
jgi:ubiquinol-cytochrome c reductase cytochrome c1 subunit